MQPAAARTARSHSEATAQQQLPTRIKRDEIAAAASADFFRDSLAKRRRVVQFSQSSQEDSDNDSDSGTSSEEEEEEFCPSFSQMVPFSQQTEADAAAMKGAMLVMSQHAEDDEEEQEKQPEEDEDDEGEEEAASDLQPVHDDEPAAEAEEPLSQRVVTFSQRSPEELPTFRISDLPEAGRSTADALPAPTPFTVGREATEAEGNGSCPSGAAAPGPAGFTAAERRAWPNARLLDFNAPSGAPEEIRAWLRTIARKQLQKLAKSLRVDSRQPSDEVRQAVGDVLCARATAAADAEAEAISLSQRERTPVASHQVWLRPVQSSSTYSRDDSEQAAAFPVGMEIILGRGRFGVSCEQVSRCQARLETSFQPTSSDEATSSTDGPNDATVSASEQVSVWLSVIGRYDCLRVVRAHHAFNPPGSCECRKKSLRPSQGDRIQLFHGTLSQGVFLLLHSTPTSTPFLGRF